MIDLSCAFTGHRPVHFSFKYNEKHKDCIALKQAIRREVMGLIEKNVTTFYCGMALGVDTWGAEVVLELKASRKELKLIAALPCQTQANHWSPEQRKRYLDLLPQCDDVIYVSNQYTPACMLRRNRYMVDRAQHLIAVYDGLGKGGTAYTVKYAQRSKRNVIIIPV